MAKLLSQTIQIDGLVLTQTLDEAYVEFYKPMDTKQEDKFAAQYGLETVPTGY